MRQITNHQNHEHLCHCYCFCDCDCYPACVILRVCFFLGCIWHPLPHFARRLSTDCQAAKAEKAAAEKAAAELLSAIAAGEATAATINRLEAALLAANTV